MDEKLLPCPFCGGEARLFQAGLAAKPYCTSCGCNLRYFDTPRDAIAAWNSCSELRPAPESGGRWEAAGYYLIVRPSPDAPVPPAHVAKFNFRQERDRALACRNACIGIREPEKAIPSARKAMRALCFQAEVDGHSEEANEHDVDCPGCSALIRAREALAALGEG